MTPPGLVAMGQAAPRSLLRRYNPLTGISLILVVSLTLLVNLDLRVSLIVLAAEVPLVVMSRMTARQWWARGWPIVLALAVVVLTNIVFASAEGGATLVDWGPLHLTTGTLGAACGVAVRLLAMALPGVLFFAILDPTELGDALVTHWRASPRFAIGSLAAVRMIPLIYDDWQHIKMARRTRGIAAGINPLRRARMVTASLVALLVSSVRRATRLAAAMDSRGFDPVSSGSSRPRTLARQSLWRRRDTLLTLATFAICIGATAYSVLSGTFRTIFG